MGAIDVCNLDVSIAVQIGGANGRQPAMGPADVRRRGHHLELAGIYFVDGKLRTLVPMRANRDHFRLFVTVEIDEARRKIFEDVRQIQFHAQPALGPSCEA